MRTKGQVLMKHCPAPFVLSGDSDRALRARARGLRRFLDTQDQLNLTDLAFALATGGTARDHRAAIVTGDRSVLAGVLSALAQGGCPAEMVRGVVGAGQDAEPQTDRAASSVAWFAARCYVSGTAIDWAAVFAGIDVGPIELPSVETDPGDHWLAELATRAKPETLPVEPETPADSSLRGRLAQLPPSARRGALLDAVLSLAAEVLERPEVRTEPGERSFQQLGFDSLTAVEFRDRLGTLAGVPLSATVIFDHPSPGAIAALLDDEIGKDPTGAYAETLAALAALERAVAANAGESAELRAVLTDRLTALLAGLEPEPEPEASADDFDSATSEEMLAYLDQKFSSR